MSRLLDGRSIFAACLLACVSFAAPASTEAQNISPSLPSITEPTSVGQVLNAADVHMETAPFSDPNPGDGHFCSTWEIRTVPGGDLAWSAVCVTGPEKIHAHFGDGTFVGAHVGRTELFPSADYVLRVRHRDDSGDTATEWSTFAERTFSTAAATQLFPLEVDDIETFPTPTWLDESGAPIELPTAATQPSLTVEQGSGADLLEIRALAGPGNEQIDAALLPDHDAIRVRLSAGSLAVGLALPASELTFTDHEGDTHTIYLPAVAATPGSDALFWVSANGATYVGSAGQTTPDFTMLARGVPVPWIVHDPGYKVEIVASGFQLPVNIAFVPAPGSAPGDVLYYVSELYGRIQAVTNDGTVSEYAGGLINFTRTGAFPGSGEQGVTGIAVDAATGDVYASMLYDAGGPHYPKVVRFESIDGGLTANTMTTILDMPGETQGQSHQISNLSFGPDGKLYVHNGDGFDASTAINLGSFRGKVLRIETDGSPVVTNPFYDAGDGITATDYVYSYGLRNPFGGAWRAADGLHYIVENGPSIDRFTQMVFGRNYLWTGSNSSMQNFALYNWSPATGPTNIAFVELQTFAGSGFPAAVQGHSYVAESGPTWATGPQTRGKRIRRYVLDAAGNLADGPLEFVEYVGTGKATVVALAAGPDGLYFSDFYKDLDFTGPTDPGSNILRVRYVGFADFIATNVQGPGPLFVSFQDASDVPGATQWDWDFGDGAVGSGPNPTHTYTVDGTYDVRLTVTGTNGVQIAEKGNFVRVGEEQFVALIGGALPPTASDAAIQSYLESAGFVVDVFDDEPANRPSAQSLAASHDVVIVSSTVLSSNIAGEFRTADVPLIFWETAMLSAAREPLSTGGTVLGGQTSIDIIDATHPLTQGLTLGSVPIAQSSSMSVAFAPFGAGVELLATTLGSASEGTILFAEAGEPLLSGYVPLARRVFLPYEDTTFLAANATGQDLIVRAVEAVLGGSEDSFRRGDCNADGTLNISDPINLLFHLFSGGATPGCADACDFSDDGVLDLADVISELGYIFQQGTPPALPGVQCGVDPTADSLSCVGGGC